MPSLLKGQFCGRVCIYSYCQQQYTAHLNSPCLKAKKSLGQNWERKRERMTWAVYTQLPQPELTNLPSYFALKWVAHQSVQKNKPLRQTPRERGKEVTGYREMTRGGVTLSPSMGGPYLSHWWSTPLFFFFFLEEKCHYKCFTQHLKSSRIPSCSLWHPALIGMPSSQAFWVLTPFPDERSHRCLEKLLCQGWGKGTRSEYVV